MNNDVLKVEQGDAVARVTLNRPEVHNAFDKGLIEQLTAAFVALSTDPAVRVVVLAGAGKSFSAGADLGEMGRMAGYSEAENREDAERLQTLFATIAHCPKITLAQVQGAALGGGAGLVAACDWAVATESASFAFSEVRLGLIPAVIAPYVVAKVGPGVARGWFVTGRRFGAVEAWQRGLVGEVVAQDALEATVEHTVMEALAAGPEAVAQVKQLLTALAGKDAAEVAGLTGQAIARIRVSPEGQEGIRAFLEKRKPGWHKP